jgi:Mg2+/Co2+ transporter CorB
MSSLPVSSSSPNAVRNHKVSSSTRRSAAAPLPASRRGKLRAQADKGSTGAAAALKVTEDNERMIGALLLGNNIVNFTSASLATALLTRMYVTAASPWPPLS